MRRTLVFRRGEFDEALLQYERDVEALMQYSKQHKLEQPQWRSSAELLQLNRGNLRGTLSEARAAVKFIEHDYRILSLGVSRIGSELLRDEKGRPVHLDLIAEKNDITYLIEVKQSTLTLQQRIKKQIRRCPARDPLSCVQCVRHALLAQTLSQRNGKSAFRPRLYLADDSDFAQHEAELLELLNQAAAHLAAQDLPEQYLPQLLSSDCTQLSEAACTNGAWSYRSLHS